MACAFNTNRNGFTFIWILENFKYCWQKTDEELRSPTFIVETMERTKWSLGIYPRGDESDQFISLYFNREADSKGPAIFEVDYELAFLAPDGSVLTSDVEYNHSFSKDDYGFGFTDFQERETVFGDQSRFLLQGTLTIRCRIWKSNGIVISDGLCTARTRIGVERKVFLWRILNFSALDVGRVITYRLKSTSVDTPIVSSNLFLRKNSSSHSILIRFVNVKQSSVFLTFKSSLVNAQGGYVNCGEHECLLSPTTRSEECTLSLSKDTLMDNNCLYLPNDTLTLHCEYSFSTGDVFGGIESTSYGCSNSVMKNSVVPETINAVGDEKLDTGISTDLKTDLRSILEDNILCDVKLCTESKTFPAHWIILSARSPVFRAMFESDMKEKAKGRINIEDLKADTVRRMLVYIYTDSLEELLWDTASELYSAAEKYQIISLKDKCSSFLKTNLSFTNACEILLLADLHQDKELKETVQNFILENDKSIINSSEWKLLMQANVNLAAETMLLRYKE